MPMLPACEVPVPAIVRSELGHDDEVADTLRHLLVAAGAEVGLPSLVGLDPLHRHRSVGR